MCPRWESGFGPFALLLLPAHRVCRAVVSPRGHRLLRARVWAQEAVADYRARVRTAIDNILGAPKPSLVMAALEGMGRAPAPREQDELVPAATQDPLARQRLVDMPPAPQRDAASAPHHEAHKPAWRLVFAHKCE